MKIRQCLAIAALLAGSSPSPGVAAQDPYHLVEVGRQLSPEEAAALEHLLGEEPEHQAPRVQLIGYYGEFDRDSEGWKQRIDHIMWLTRNQPEAEVLATPEAEIDRWLEADAYLDASSAWSQHLASMPENLNVLRNAADFHTLGDPKLAIELLERGQRIDGSDPEWASALGQLHILEMGGSRGEPDPNAAARALIQFERAYELLGKADGDHLLEDLAKAAFVAGETKKAREYADAMLSNAAGGWNFGNRIHHGHLTLGRLALAEGNLEEARDRLLKAGQTPGSPQLDTFGPNMALAKDLLERGEKEVVLKYFELCSEFWNSERDLNTLAEWTSLARAGRMPDFGANLVY